MKVTTEELEQCEVLMTVEVEPKQEQKMLQKAAKRIAREVRIPGFRPGKAPYNIVVRRFGLEAVQQEALEQSIDKMIQEALENADVEPFAQIHLDSVDWDPLTVKVKIPTKPKVKLGNYRDIRLDVEEIEVTEEDIEEALKNLQEQTATWAPVDRPAEIGDLISMAVVEKDGDTVLAEHESVEHELDPPEEHEGHNHPDLTTPLLGLSAGDEKTFTVTYPEEFGDDRYAGKDITFDVEILGVKEQEVDPLDDEFAKSVSDFDTLDELKADIENNIRQRREGQQNETLGNQVVDKIIEDAHIEWPQAFEDEVVEQEVKRVERQMESYGLTIDNFLQVQGKTRDEFSEDTRQDVIEQLRRNLVISEVAKLENLDVSQSEILEQAKRIADYSGQGDQVWRNILASQSQQNRIANDLLIEKTMNWLAAIAKGEDPQVETEPEADDETAAEEDEEATGAPDTEAVAEEVPAKAQTDKPDTDESSEDESAQEEPATTKA